jgi:5-methylcytosine-specific restriction endonuclease McrA
LENISKKLNDMKSRFHVGKIRNSSLTRSRFGDYDFKEEIMAQIGMELPEKGHGTYGKLLFDKRWFARRAEILARDNSCCVICASGEKLQVHHRQYHYIVSLRQFKAPWDYVDNLMVTLCERCHGRGHAQYHVPIIYL